MTSEKPGEKKYGLIIPSKKNARSMFCTSAVSESKPKVFAADSSSDDNLEDDDDGKAALDWRSRTAAKSAEKSIQRNQARLAAMKALEEDPTIFQYDEVYDKMEQKREERKPVKQEKKPKYIANLLRTAEQRKVEQERRAERKVQKEREAEGDMYNDKEAFVTPAYRAKLAELQKLEEEEKHREQLEAMLDVTKQRDLSGFYRHLYNQTFANECKEEVKIETTSFKSEPTDKEQKTSRRQYRQRREESPEPQLEEENRSDSEDVTDIPESLEAEKEKTSPEKRDMRPAASASLIAAAASDRAAALDRAEKSAAKKREEIQVQSSDESRSSSPVEEEVKENLEPKVKINIWEKRTVGDILDDALERYRMRKEARESGLVPWP
nr:EOG090X0D2W [Cyclestheria hislopi]